ncbi:uncharacterized protein LOC132631198 [Lycium barbarum]|uniref:uncharacterized protein LOC132631198 n=1 Tax=Lycium barbarum TaxID=112863 RepID=UPI00293EB6E8|nr:uncharacterized protein LOC132631198 [Lycium barbarum]
MQQQIGHCVGISFAAFQHIMQQQITCKLVHFSCFFSAANAAIDQIIFSTILDQFHHRDESMNGRKGGEEGEGNEVARWWSRGGSGSPEMELLAGAAGGGGRSGVLWAGFVAGGGDGGGRLWVQWSGGVREMAAGEWREMGNVFITFSNLSVYRDESMNGRKGGEEGEGNEVARWWSRGGSGSPEMELLAGAAGGGGRSGVLWAGFVAGGGDGGGRLWVQWSGGVREMAAGEWREMGNVFITFSNLSS